MGPGCLGTLLVLTGRAFRGFVWSFRAVWVGLAMFLVLSVLRSSDDCCRSGGPRSRVPLLHIMFEDDGGRGMPCLENTRCVCAPAFVQAHSSLQRFCLRI